jgi:hypothetical protein
LGRVRSLIRGESRASIESLSGSELRYCHPWRPALTARTLDDAMLQYSHPRGAGIGPLGALRTIRVDAGPLKLTA